jgi:hypothetical protein
MDPTERMRITPDVDGSRFDEQPRRERRGTFGLSPVSGDPSEPSKARERRLFRLAGWF